MKALFIGSFNPPTKAHINICVKLKNMFSQIIMVPVNSSDKRVIDINYRISMLNILKSKYPFLEISNIMKKYAYLNYRIIDVLKKEYDSNSIIMGSDLLEKFTSFDNYEYILDNYYLYVIPRDNMNVKKLIEEKYSKYQDKFKIVNYHSRISSSLVKNYLKENKNVKSLLDKDVLEFIEKNHLY